MDTLFEPLNIISEALGAVSLCPTHPDKAVSYKRLVKSLTGLKGYQRRLLKAACYRILEILNLTE